MRETGQGRCFLIGQVRILANLLNFGQRRADANGRGKLLDARHVLAIVGQPVVRQVERRQRRADADIISDSLGPVDAQIAASEAH